MDGKLPKLGAAVTYRVEITNGARAVPIGNTFSFTTTPAFDAGSLTCTMPDASNAPGLAVTVGNALPAELAAAATINCAFKVTVTTAHQAAGKIGAINVQPGFVGSPMDYSLSVVPRSSADVAVASGVQLAAAASFATSIPSIIGE